MKEHARMSTSVIIFIATPNQQFRTEGALRLQSPKIIINNSVLEKARHDGYEKLSTS